MTHKGLPMTATSPRITTRVTPDIQDLLSHAASLIGISSINSFVLSAAIEKANLIMKNENNLVLNKEDTILFIEALEKTSQKNEALSSAYKNYNSFSSNE